MLNALILGEKKSKIKQVLENLVAEQLLDKVKFSDDYESLPVQFFADQFQVFFLHEEEGHFIEQYFDDLEKLPISIFLLCESKSAFDNHQCKNIYALQLNNLCENTLHILLEMSRRYYNEQTNINHKHFIDNLDEFIYVKNIPFESRHISYFSNRVKEILGYEPHDKGILLDFDQCVHPEDRSIAELNSAEKVDQAVHSTRIRIKHAEKDAYVWIERKVIPQYKNGKLSSAIFLCRDVSSEVAYLQSEKRNHYYDKLTSLPNKTWMAEKIQVFYVEKKIKNFAVFCISLDRFKNVNDALGHGIGDQVIVEVGARIKKALKVDDLVARFTGDEFLACSINLDYLHEATFLADAIVDNVNQPFLFDDNEIYLSCSIGIAMNNSFYHNADALINDAYQAMHKAKQDVLANYTIFEHDKHNLSSLGSINLESDLRRALKKDELFLEFQPLVSLRDDSVNTIEALVRWQHPKKGLMMPDQFIALAEKTGLIVELGEWVINESIYAINEILNNDNDLSIEHVSINISPVQLGQIDLCERLDQLMVEHQLPSHSIKFEVTESVVMNEENAMHGILSQFKSMGIQLSMDDFGTGYSSLSYLNHLPFNFVKIDKSFIADVYAKGSGKDFVNTIIQLAHNMDMEVVAEGVETAEQAMVLRNLGCEYAQGFFFSKPVTLAHLPAALRKMPTNKQKKQFLS